jgi:hypothetical protein
MQPLTCLQAFVYEPVPLHGYSFAWNTDLDPHNISQIDNPNNRIEATRPFPPQCPSYSDARLVQLRLIRSLCLY